MLLCRAHALQKILRLLYLTHKRAEVTVIATFLVHIPSATQVLSPEAFGWDSEPAAPAAPVQGMRCEQLLNLAGRQEHGIQLGVLDHCLRRHGESEAFRASP